MKRFIALFMALLVFLSVSLPQQTLAAGFSDVPSKHGFYTDIMYLLENNVIDSQPKYGVDDYVTRAEVATMVSKSLKLDGKQVATAFKDVPASHVASGYIQSAYQSGIIKGVSKDTFNPSGLVTRGDMAIFLARAFQLSTESQLVFKDMSPSMASYSSVKQIVQAKITTGYSDQTFKPNALLTRGQISAFLARAMKQQGGIVSPKPTPPITVPPAPVPPASGMTGNLIITAKDLSNEIVTIKNQGTSTVNIANWELVSVVGNQIFVFPSYSLAPGATVFVTSGPKAKSGGNYFAWTTSNMWNNDGDAAKLVDPFGKIVFEMK